MEQVRFAWAAHYLLRHSLLLLQPANRHKDCLTHVINLTQVTAWLQTFSQSFLKTSWKESSDSKAEKNKNCYEVEHKCAEFLASPPALFLFESEVWGTLKSALVSIRVSGLWQCYLATPLFIACHPFTLRKRDRDREREKDWGWRVMKKWHLLRLHLWALISRPINCPPVDGKVSFL